ncbi:hypothetical protein GCM10007981_00910 [Thermocladium modestius]|uniref:Glycosyltransferase 2-like domain-containing protein n=2 Tax=Thermocladium modestius TaxID=62609 RepID=A0A830GRH5_9CREN|nr:hypothetical protein GCM10007981_00910 [Thermocladium modestius]
MSLEKQTLDKGEFEVIIVKNFEDKAIDNIISRNGWKNIVTNTIPLGGKIAIGLEEAKGEVITFLEDDDMYKPERLQFIKNVFSRYRNVVYFHNRQDVIDEHGNVIPLTIARYMIHYGALLNYSDMIIDEKLKKIPCAMDYINLLTGADFNNSSIAIRRISLSKNDLNVLKSMQTGIDLYLYSKTFAFIGSLYLTSLKLTYYRTHSSNLSAYSSLNYPINEKYIIKLIMQRYLLALIRIKNVNNIVKLANINCPSNMYKDFLKSMELEMLRYSTKYRILEINVLNMLKDAILINNNTLQRSLTILKLINTLNAKSIFEDELEFYKKFGKFYEIYTMGKNFWYGLLYALSTYLLQYMPDSIRLKYLEYSIRRSTSYIILKMQKYLKSKGI